MAGVVEVRAGDQRVDSSPLLQRLAQTLRHDVQRDAWGRVIPPKFPVHARLMLDRTQSVVRTTADRWRGHASAAGGGDSDNAFDMCVTCTEAAMSAMNADQVSIASQL